MPAQVVSATSRSGSGDSTSRQPVKTPISVLIARSRDEIETADFFYHIVIIFRYWFYNFIVTAVAVLYPNILRAHTDCPLLELVKVKEAEPEIVRILVYQQEDFWVRWTNLCCLGLRSSCERVPKLDVAVYASHLDYCITAALARDMTPDPDTLIKTVRLALTSKAQPESMSRSVMGISIATGTISTVLRQRLRRWYIEGVQSVSPWSRKVEFNPTSEDRTGENNRIFYAYCLVPATAAYYYGGSYYMFWLLDFLVIKTPAFMWKWISWLVCFREFWMVVGLYVSFCIFVDWVLIPLYKKQDARARRYLDEYMSGIPECHHISDTVCQIVEEPMAKVTNSPSDEDVKVEPTIEPPTAVSIKSERESIYKLNGLLSTLDDYTPTPIKNEGKTKRSFTAPMAQLEESNIVQTEVYDEKFVDLVSANWGSENLKSYSSYLSTSSYNGPVSSDRPNVRNGKVDYKGITSALTLAGAPIVDPEIASFKRNAVEDNKKDSTFTHYGPMYLGRLPSMFNSNAHNESIALAHRHCLPAPSGSFNVAFWKLAKRSLGSSFDLKSLVDRYWGDGPSIDSWLASMDSKKAKPLREFLENPSEFSHADYRRSSFIKADMQLPKAGGRLEEEAPRLIQALRKQTTNVYLGPFMSHLSKVVAKPFLEYQFFESDDIVSSCLADELPQCLYSSGADSMRIGQWYDHHVNKGRKFLENDFSRFDSTQGEGASLIEHLYYEETGHLNDNIKIALKNQTRTSGDGKYHSYRVNWTRKSGDQNTSIGNTLINITALGGALNAFKNLKKHEEKFSNFNWWMIALGDDNAIAYEGCQDEDLSILVDYVEKFLRNLGLKPKLAACKVPSYLSAFFVPCQVREGKHAPINTHVLMPNLVDHLSKMGVTTGMMTDCAVGRMKGNLGGLGNTRHMPIVRVFHDYYCSRSELANTSGAWANQHHQLTSAEVRPTDATFRWYESTYGISENEIDDFETFLATHLRNTGGLASFWLHPTMEKMIESLRSNRM